LPKGSAQQDKQQATRAELTLRFFWVLTIGLAIVLVFVNAIFLLPSIRTIESDTSSLQLEIAFRAKTSLLSSLESTFDSQRRAASSVGRDPEKVQEILELFIRDNKFFEEVIFISPGGKELIRLNRTSYVAEQDLENRKDEIGVIEGLRGNVYYGPVAFSSNAEPFQEIFVPVVSLQGEVVAVMTSRLNLKFIWDLMGEIRVGKSEKGRVYIVDQRGNLIADPNPSVVLRGENLFFRPLVKKVIEEKRIVDGLDSSDRYLDFDGTEVFAVGIPLEATGWGIIVEQPLQDAFEARNRTIYLGIASIVVSIILIFVLGFNIRELVRVARDLNRERNQTFAIISHLTDGLIQYDDTFTILMVNDSALRMVGVKVEDILGKRFAAHDISKPGLTSFLQVLFPILSASAHVVPLPSGQPKTIEMQLREPFEQDIQIVTIPVVDPVTAEVNYMKILHDVTRERAIDRTKSEFISIAAHQLRTPLSAIKWTFRLILDGDLGEINSDQKSFIEKGYESNERLIRLVSDLLDVARIEEGRFGYVFSQGSLSDLVRKAFDSFQELARQKRVNLLLENPAREVPLLKFDSGKIFLVIQNLVENAIHYTREGGKVIIRYAQEGDFARVSVVDTGVGIPKHQMNRLFSKFFRAENVIRMETEGSGLGLFIVRNIVRRHGGDVDVVSEEGKGSTFSFTLPIKESLIPPSSTVSIGL